MAYCSEKPTPGVTIIGVRELVVDARFWSATTVINPGGVRSGMIAIDSNGLQTEAHVDAGIIEIPPHYHFDCKVKLRFAHEHFDLVAI